VVIVKSFVYLVQSAANMPYADIQGPDSDVLLLTWSRPADWPDAVFLPGSSWNEGRNRLLWEARQRARRMGGDYRYYIFMDDDCRLHEDALLADQLGIPLTGNPFRTFEGFLREWEPAVGYTRYDWQHYEEGRPVNLGHNIDALFIAFHWETLDLLLPYYTGFDSESWLYSQHIINHLASLFYHPYRIQYNLITTTNTRRKGYAPRKKYWQIPTTFLSGALKPARRADLNTETPNTALPAPGHPRKKDRSYRIAPDALRRHFNLAHPLVAHRRLEQAQPQAVRRIDSRARVAVCMSGRCAGLARTHDNLRRYLFDRLPAYDLFMFVPLDAHTDQAHLLAPTVLETAPDRPIDEGGLRNGQNCLIKVGVQAYLQQLQGLKACDRLRRRYARQNGVHYAAVIRCRPDVLFEAPLPDPTALDLNYLYVPDFHMYEGVNDRFAIGRPAYMQIYMAKIDDFETYVGDWTQGHAQAPPVTAEMFTAGHLRQHGIPTRRLKVRFNRIRAGKIKRDTVSRH
jgi:hypothetical protein